MTKTYYVGVIERAIAYYDVEAENARAAAENWQDGEFSDRDDEALESEGPCSVSEQQPGGGWRKLPRSEWDDKTPAADASLPLLTACRMVVERWEHGDLAEAVRTCSAAIAQAEKAGSFIPCDPARKPYSVLLHYPDYLDDTGYETYYAFVEAQDTIEAIAVAQRQAAAAQEGIDINDPTDFAPLLVTQGHQHSEPLFNK